MKTSRTAEPPLDLTPVGPGRTVNDALSGREEPPQDLAQRLIEWAQNEEMVDQYYTAHGKDCLAAAAALAEAREQIEELIQSLRNEHSLRLGYTRRGGYSIESTADKVLAALDAARKGKK